jgi:pimeloyl-ACP methyl ester carboxylesterase
MAEAALAEAPERFCLAGFSLGSQVALEMMDVAGERVERLALLSATRGGLLPATAAALGEAIAAIEHGGFEQYLEAAYPSYVAERRVQDEALKRTFMAMAHDVGERAGLRQMRVLLEIREPFAKLNQIRCRTIVIGGCEDHRTTPAAHRQLAEEIRGAELLMIEDAGHFTPLEQPAAVTEALRLWMSQ